MNELYRKAMKGHNDKVWRVVFNFMDMGIYNIKNVRVSAHRWIPVFKDWKTHTEFTVKGLAFMLPNK